MTSRELISPDEPEGDNMMGNERSMILTPLLKAQEHDDHLMRPVGRMHDIVPFEIRYHVPVRVPCSLLRNIHKGT
jgi:hypothetical protein